MKSIVLLTRSVVSPVRSKPRVRCSRCRRSNTASGTAIYDRGTVVNEAKGKAESLIRARSIYDAKKATRDALTGALAQANNQIGAAERQRETYALRLSELRASAENVAIRTELVTAIGDLPAGIESEAFQDVRRSLRPGRT